MHQHRWYEGSWVAWAIGVLMLAVTALDLAFPLVAVLPALVVLVMVAALAVGPRATACLAGLAMVLMLVGALLHDDFATPNGWIELIGVIVAGAIAILLSLELASQRSRILERESQYRLLAENASDIVVRVALDGTLEWISPSVRTVLGYEPEALIGTHPWDLIHPDDQPAAANSLANAAQPGHIPAPLVTRFQRTDGSYVWLSAIAGKTAEGPFIVSFRQVDEEVRARAALEDSEVHYRLLAENAMDLVFSLDMHAKIEWVSPSAITMLGYEPGELEGKFGGMLIHPDDLPLLLEAASKAREGVPASCQIRMLRSDGDVRWVEATPRGLYDDDETLVGGVIGVRDIHEEVLTREALVRAVELDPLTGLAGASLALQNIAEALEDNDPRRVALICVGVNGMTYINQAYTYAAGDAVLSVVGERLVGAVGSDGSVARIAGDEFVVLLTDITDATDAASAAEELLAAVRGPVRFGDVEIDVTAGAGIALADQGDAQELLRDSTAAMRQSAIRGPDRWEFLDGDVEAQTRRELAVQASLREGIRAGRLEPWFMPIVGLADGQPIGYEVLARLVRPDGSISLPAEFLKGAERTGLIVSIDQVMLERALALLHDDDGIERLAVNVSAATLASGSLATRIVDLLQRVDVDLRRLHLEVTETSLFTVTDDVRRTMEAIAGLGVSWWVDDFGTGFSSISHLRDLPIAGLKLDQSFTRTLTLEETASTRLAQGLVGLAQGLGLQTIAEGVETEQQKEALIRQGWKYGQGWLFGRPVAALPSPA